MNENDDLSGIFDDLTPDDFSLDTSAIEEAPRQNRGTEAFNAFVDEQLRAVRMAYAASEGMINPIAILANSAKQRVFTPDDDESMGQYVKRLNREARRMGATWVFISRKTLVGYHFVAREDLHDVSDQEQIAEAAQRGLLKTGLVWFAERREGGERHRRHGIIPTLREHILATPEEGDGSQPIPLFDTILG